jgi:hypothetical protein
VIIPVFFFDGSYTTINAKEKVFAPFLIISSDVAMMPTSTITTQQLKLTIRTISFFGSFAIASPKNIGSALGIRETVFVVLSFS